MLINISPAFKFVINLKKINIFKLMCEVVNLIMTLSLETQYDIAFHPTSLRNLQCLHCTMTQNSLGLKLSRQGYLFKCSLRSLNSAVQCWLDAVY
jgi:hypothetical protein